MQALEMVAPKPQFIANLNAQYIRQLIHKALNESDLDADQFVSVLAHPELRFMFKGLRARDVFGAMVVTPPASKTVVTVKTQKRHMLPKMDAETRRIIDNHIIQIIKNNSKTGGITTTRIINIILEHHAGAREGQVKNFFDPLESKGLIKRVKSGTANKWFPA